ncbi:MAG: DUF1343 domain-containing protein [Chlorobiaceae bacterium]|nr:DUF1343 domain-containing protein [Chlorobiaceae bacterium]
MNQAVRIATLLLVLLCQAFRLDAATLRTGLDVLDAGRCRALKGMRVGLVTNVSALSGRGEPGYRVLLRHGVDLKFLMAPEHGFSIDREAGEKVPGASLLDTLRIHSLYGASRKPEAAVLNGVDVLVFDLQDVGVRCYTYVSTMKLCMEACRDAGIGFMVLDRPNPVAPIPPSGFVLEPAYESFVGADALPFLHGMTVGEIAVWLQKHRFPELSLQVVQMKGYRRGSFADELDGFRFIPPSPNIRDLETAILYPATVMLEATEVSEGRGTDAPFRMIGAPFIDSAALKRELDGFRLPGVEVREAAFTPSVGKFAGRECRGLRFSVTDRRAFDPFRTSTALLLSLRKLHPEKLGLNRHALFFDRLAGNGRYRLMIQEQRPIGEILVAASGEIRTFEATAPERYLYP